MNLTLEVRRHNGFAVVALKGDVDVFSAPKLREKLITLIEGGERHFIVDMDGLELCDSNGLEVLISGLRRVREHQGSLSIVCTRDKMLRIFRSTGLADVFSIHDSVGSAVAAERAGNQRSLETPKR